VGGTKISSFETDARDDQPGEDEFATLGLEGIWVVAGETRDSDNLALGSVDCWISDGVTSVHSGVKVWVGHHAFSDHLACSNTSLCSESDPEESPDPQSAFDAHSDTSASSEELSNDGDCVTYAHERTSGDWQDTECAVHGEGPGEPFSPESGNISLVGGAGGSLADIELTVSDPTALGVHAFSESKHVKDDDPSN